MSALVLGATGCVGSAIAEGLLSHGFSVFGLARSEQASRSLKAQGIHPVLVSNVQDIASWISEGDEKKK